MKKLITLFLATFFLIANSGWAVTVHVCGNKLAAVSFFVPEKHPCKCSAKTMKPNCCRQKTSILKANLELGKITIFQIKAPVIFVTLIPFINLGLLSAILTQQHVQLFCNAPPIGSLISFVVLFREYRI